MDTSMTLPRQHKRQPRVRQLELRRVSRGRQHLSLNRRSQLTRLQTGRDCLQSVARLDLRVATFFTIIPTTHGCI